MSCFGVNSSNLDIKQVNICIVISRRSERLSFYKGPKVKPFDPSYKRYRLAAVTSAQEPQEADGFLFDS